VRAQPLAQTLRASENTVTRVIGHRGASGLWPENSLGGFRNVITLAVDAVEFDVHLVDSGELLVIHDATIERTTECTGPCVTCRQRSGLA
jgi:glycerophosphoryl diester phosphodiesterase